MDAKTNLIVNYLPSSLNQDDVKKMFERVGAVLSCKLVRSKVTGQSLGYAFIQYADEDSAAKAITEITGTEMQGKKIKVSLARQSSQDIKNANVYVAGLPLSVSEDKLLTLFSLYGSVLSHKVLTNPDGTSRGAGFVRFSSNSEAADAIKQMAGQTLPDATGPLTVKLAIPAASKTDSMQALSAITTNTLAGVGVASRTANVRFNPMSSSNQMILNRGNMHASNPASAVAAAISGMNAHIAQNSGITHQQSASVYVFGLQPTHTELTLYELFSPFGGILNVKLIRDLTKEDKPCKGYGFVNYAKNDDALRAVTSMNGVQFEDKLLQVSFKQNKNQSQVPTHLAQYNTMGLMGMGVGITA